MTSKFPGILKTTGFLPAIILLAPPKPDLEGTITKKCKTNPISEGERLKSRDENMQNEPNFNQRASREEKLQNEPNLATSPIRFDPAYGPRVTSHESRFMQNEPNFTPNAPTKHANAANFTQNFHSLLQLFTRQMRTFPQKSRKIRTFCNFWILTHLTPCT
jgi:hypothetical protein